jgi:hypothetical protein
MGTVPQPVDGSLLAAGYYDGFPVVAIAGYAVDLTKVNRTFIGVIAFRRLDAIIVGNALSL